MFQNGGILTEEQGFLFLKYACIMCVLVFINTENVCKISRLLRFIAVKPSACQPCRRYCKTFPAPGLNIYACMIAIMYHILVHVESILLFAKPVMLSRAPLSPMSNEILLVVPCSSRCDDRFSITDLLL